MRKLKLQTQITPNGFICGPNGELDFMEWNWDSELEKYVTELTDSIGTILLGRKMSEGFIPHWENITKDPDNPDYIFARKMNDTPRIVFSKTLEEIKGENVKLEKRDLTDAVNELKQQDGKDIIAYGGASFVSSLIKHDLIDEYNLFVNPTVISSGLTIFNEIDEKKKLNLVKAKQFKCGIALLCYERG